MRRIRSGDAEIVYEVLGDGPPVVLLHPFPANHEFWLPVSQLLVSHYKLILPDLRGHGDSGIGEGPATMEKHAADIARVMDDADVGRAPLIGVSIGGYIIFEFWRRNRGRVAAMALCNTKAQADTPEARAGRLQSATDVLERGTGPFIGGMVPKLLGKTTRETRPDLVEGAVGMMRKMSPEDVALVQRGMAERPDSVPTLKTINVPTLLVTGEEDILTGVPEAELMRQNIAGSQMKMVPKAGHYSAWEQPEEVGILLRQFLDEARGNYAALETLSSLLQFSRMIDTLIVPKKTVASAKGEGSALDISAAKSRVFLLTLCITKIIEQEALDVSIHGSADGTTWSAAPLASFPQKFYAEESPLLLDLTGKKDIRFLRAQWNAIRWGRGSETPMFEFHMGIREVPAEILKQATAEAKSLL